MFFWDADSKRLGRVETLLIELLAKVTFMATDLTALEQRISDLEAKATETVDTLLKLAQAVIDLKNAPDVQPAVDALAVRAQAIIDKLTVAEDAADDQVQT